MYYTCIKLTIKKQEEKKEKRPKEGDPTGFPTQSGRTAHA